MSWLKHQRRCCRISLECQEWQEDGLRVLRNELSDLTGGVFQLCYSPGDLPSHAPCLWDSILLSPPTVSTLRSRVHATAAIVGMNAERCADLTTAASEAAMNAILHGNGGSAQVGITAMGTVQVWVSDAGEGIPKGCLRELALTHGFSTAGTIDKGFERMQVVDRLWLLTGTGGTTLVLEQDQGCGRHRKEDCRVGLWQKHGRN